MVETTAQDQTANAERAVIARDTQVKGRVMTFWLYIDQNRSRVVQTVDGSTTFTQEYETRLEAADDYAMLRAHARRNLHEYLASTQPEIGSYQDSQTRGIARDQRQGN